MHLCEVEELAHVLLGMHGLADWRFAFNRRKRSLGLCRYSLKQVESVTAFRRSAQRARYSRCDPARDRPCLGRARSCPWPALEGDLPATRRETGAVRRSPDAKRPVACKVPDLRVRIQPLSPPDAPPNLSLPEVRPEDRPIAVPGRSSHPLERLGATGFACWLQRQGGHCPPLNQKSAVPRVVRDRWAVPPYGYGMRPAIG